MHTYVGSGPYCYANSVAMMLGPAAPPPSVIEVLTGSPFGLELIAGRLPLFDPFGWDPDRGIDDALGLLGWSFRREGAADDEQALALLRDALEAGPAMAGPVEMGLLRHQPGMTGAVGADHFVVVLSVDDSRVLMHDPHGHPYATLPIGEFLAAWRGESIAYRTAPYTVRHDFRRVREVTASSALRAAIPRAVAWLRGRDDVAVPPGTLGGAAAAERIAEMIESGLSPEVRGVLTEFAVRVGARRLADAATALAGLGLDEAAAVATRQARLVGSLQYDLVVGEPAAAAATMRELAPSYEELAKCLAA